MDPIYLTTAIPFVNAPPHLGHALEFVQTDVIARHARARGRAVRFLTGTDEHAPKVVQAAAAAGEDVAAFVARNAELFAALAGTLEVSYDDFIRTSADPRHLPVVEAVWRRVRGRAATCTARRTQAGTATGASSSSTAACREHDAPLEWVEEENWYFRLSRYAERIRGSITSDELRIVPAARRNEVLAFLDSDVRDISVSRSRARARDWGIPVPGDPDQIIYVWFDALINYLSAAPAGWWSESLTIRHVIGKGIVRFHAVIWPAILLSAGLPLPDELFVHDYVTANGRKIGKSLGNAVDPLDLVARFGVDALRWWLFREVPRVGEADFTEDAPRRDREPRPRERRRQPRPARRRPRRRRRTRRAPRPARTSSLVARGRRGNPRLRPASGDRCDRRRGRRGQPRDRDEPTVDARRVTTGAGAVAPLAVATRVIVDELAPFVPDLAAHAARRLDGTERRRTGVRAAQLSACSARRRAMTRRQSVSSAPSKIESTRASTK